MKKIDFVITWVDGNDSAWREEKARYSGVSGDQKKNRFRDWDILQYWFRGIEKFAAWVNCVYFVTWGHIPGWLNTDHPKLKIIRHEEFIPKEYLPTFNSHTIEFNLHRIQDLSEQFVYFNDDTLLLSAVRSTDFFVHGLPCDMAVLYPLHAGDGDGSFEHIILNNSYYFNKNFDFKQCIRENFIGWFNLRYGKNLLKTFFMLPFPEFSGFMTLHQPQSFLKNSFKTIWDREHRIVHETCQHKFRTEADVSPYLIRYWQLANGQFSASNLLKRGIYCTLENQAQWEEVITKQKFKMICLNDASMELDYELTKKKLKGCFQRILPDRSSYERK